MAGEGTLDFDPNQLVLKPSISGKIRLSILRDNGRTFPL